MKKLLQVAIALFLCLSCAATSFAHSGRTDSSGGHKDNKNASGLGSYHYHHGYPPHLHTNGVCPYSENSGLTSSSTQRNSSSSASAQEASKPKTSLTQAEQELAAKIQATIQQAQRDGKTAATHKIINGTALSQAVLQEIGRQAKATGIALTLSCDTVQDEKLKVRLTIKPELATQSIAITASLDNEQAQKTKAKYEKLCSNHVQVVSPGQQSGFGMTVEIVVKVDVSQLKTDTLIVYAYDPRANSHKQIPAGDCFVDDNNFVHINTSLAGDLVITDQLLTLK